MAIIKVKISNLQKTLLRETKDKVQAGKSDRGLDSRIYHELLKLNNKKRNMDIPAGPVVNTLHSQCRGTRLDTWSGNYAWHSQINKYFFKKEKKQSNKNGQGTSLVVQCLRLYAFTAGAHRFHAWSGN